MGTYTALLTSALMVGPVVSSAELDVLPTVAALLPTALAPAKPSPLLSLCEQLVAGDDAVHSLASQLRQQARFEGRFIFENTRPEVFHAQVSANLIFFRFSQLWFLPPDRTFRCPVLAFEPGGSAGALRCCHAAG